MRLSRLSISLVTSLVAIISLMMAAGCCRAELPVAYQEPHALHSQVNGIERREQVHDVASITIRGVEYCTSLTWLHLVDMGLSNDDIAPLRHMVNLTNLSLNSNQISDISPLSGLVSLEWLSLQDNEISDISSLSGLFNLGWLSLDGNLVSEVSPLSELLNLQELHVRENPVRDIASLTGFVFVRDVLYSTSLTSLSLFCAGLSDEDIAPLRFMSNLMYLYIGGCATCDQEPAEAGSYAQISDITVLSELVHLRALTLTGNQVSDIAPLAYLTNLEELNLVDNLISDISPLADLTNLVELSLAHNQIHDIEPLAYLTNLTFLHLSDNQIHDLAPLSGLTNLKWAFLGNNEVHDWSPVEHVRNVAGRP